MPRGREALRCKQKQMEQKQFQAESKKLMDMMIHSIYTHKEIFLRELISNASDAIDKLYFKSLTDDSVGMNKSDFKITLAVDKDARTLTITDNGIGMTKAEMEEHLGTIANSGSLQFKKENNLAEDNQIIGQFGVGFYSAFMVAKRVTVKSLAFGEKQAYVWQSEGVEGYTMDTCEKDTVGTEITLELLDDVVADAEGNGGENYSEFLDQYRIQSLVKRYSDYIRFPICMDMTKSRKKEDSDEYEEYVENVTLNSMVPLWHKNKNEISEEEYNSFYKDKCGDYTDPLCHMHVRNEGTITYDALLYIPSHTPFNYYSKDYEKGLQLYANGVLIMEKCPDLLPDHFSFVRGLIDSADLSLNISREMLQHDHQLKIIAKAINRKIKNELTRMLKNEREKYEAFFKTFGVQLKFGVYANYGAEKDDLKDLLLFKSSAGEGMVTLKEYVDGMAEGQDTIYYACGDTAEKIALLPQTDAVLSKGYQVLYLTDDVDEFALQMLMEYDGKKFANITKDDLNLESEDEKKAMEQKNADAKGLLDTMKEALGEEVSAVKFSGNLGSHAVCLSAEGYLSMEMEKVLSSMPGGGQGAKAQLVLEINDKHPLAEKLFALLKDDPETLKKYTKILYDQARLISGLDVQNPTALADSIVDMML